MTATLSRDISALIASYLAEPDAAVSARNATFAALTDALVDAGLEDVAREIGREGFTVDNLLTVVAATGRKVGRKAIHSWLAAEMKAAALKVYEPRRDRQVNPEGNFDSAGRWYPAYREDAGDVAGCVRSPSRAWPYSYMVACRAKKHAAQLVRLCVLGVEVPADVKAAAEPVRAALLAELARVV